MVKKKKGGLMQTFSYQAVYLQVALCSDEVEGLLHLFAAPRPSHRYRGPRQHPARRCGLVRQSSDVQTDHRLPFLVRCLQMAAGRLPLVHQCRARFGARASHHDPCSYPNALYLGHSTRRRRRRAGFVTRPSSLGRPSRGRQMY